MIRKQLYDISDHDQLINQMKYSLRRTDYENRNGK